MAKTKVKSSSSKQFVHPGGTVNISNPAGRTKVHGVGPGKGAKSVGKQTSHAARPK